MNYTITLSSPAQIAAVAMARADSKFKTDEEFLQSIVELRVADWIQTYGTDPVATNKVIAALQARRDAALAIVASLPSG
jgi:hypothetical protein